MPAIMHKMFEENKHMHQYLEKENGGSRFTSQDDIRKDKKNF